MRNIDEMTEYLSLLDSETPTFRSIDRLPISAPNNERAVEVARQLLDRFHEDMSLEEYNTQIEAAWRSARGPSRWVLSARNPVEMKQSLEDYIFENRVSASGNRHTESRKVVFVFSGMGPQWGGMGRELASNLPRFTQYIKHIDHELAKYYGWSVWNELNQHYDAMQLPTALAQTSNFLIQAALYHLLCDENIKPEAIIGHSAGEIAAAYAAGIYTLEEACQIAVTRGRLQASLSGRGSMLAVGLSHSDALEAIKPYPGISIAAVNDASACTVAGDSVQIDQLEAQLKENEVFAKKLRVEVPYHSPVMDEITDAITTELSFIEPKPAKTTLYSTVTGKESNFQEWTSDYWAKNIRQPVLFADAINCLLESSKNCFIEISPHPVLSQSLGSLSEGHSGISIHHLLSRRSSEYDTFSTTLCDLAINSVGRPKQIASAPLIKPVRTVQSLWDDDPDATSMRQGKLAFEEIPLLGQVIHDTTDHFKVELSLEDQPWIEGHTVQGLGPIVPATMWAELFSLAVTKDGTPNARLHNLSIVQALSVGSNPTIVSLKIDGATARCYSRPAGETGNWTLHATTSIAPAPVNEESLADSISYNPDPHGTKLNPNTVYNSFRLKGLNYTGHFKNLTEITVGTEQQAWATISGVEDFNVGLHSPWVLDAGLQLLIVAAKDWGEVMYLPFRIGKVSLYHPITECTDYHAHAEVNVITEAELIGTVRYFDQDGKLLAELKEITCIRNLSDDIERINYFDKFTYAISNLTPEEIADRNTLEEFQSDQQDVASDAEIENEIYDESEQYWISGSVNTELFERACFNISDLTSDSEVHLLWNVPNHSLQQDILATTKILQNIGQYRARNVTLTLIGASTQSWLYGLRRSAANSYGFNVRVVTYDTETSLDLVEGAISLTMEHEIVLESDEPYFRRLDQVSSSDLRMTENVSKQSVQEGSIPRSTLSFEFIRGQLKKLIAVKEPLPPLGKADICVEIEASPLMWKDIGKVLGSIGSGTVRTFSHHHIGTGIAGRVIAAGSDANFKVGDHVFGAARRGFRQHIVFTAEESLLLRKVPKGIDGATAVAHVTPLLTAKTVLDEPNIEPGSSIFIQSGAGGLGSVLCIFANQLGYKVVTSVGTEDKVAEVQKFLPNADIIVARGNQIPDTLLKAGYKGFDRILATVTGNARTSLISQLNNLGHYIDLGKPEKIDESLFANTFDGNKAYQVIDVDQLIARVPGWLRDRLDYIVEKLSNKQNLAPVNCYSIKDATTAIVDMAQGNTSGLVTLNISQDYKPETLTTVSVKLDPEANYIVTGGYGAVGLICAQWLSSRGARSIILTGRSGKINSDAKATLDLIRSNGTKVTIIQSDSADKSSVKEMIDEVNSLDGPIRGVIHAAGVISDGTFDEIDEKRIEKSYGPKLEGAHHLVDILDDQDALSSLDFILFTSSISSVVGLSIQGTYASANSGLDGLAESLTKRGINACAIQLGAVADNDGSGMASDESVQRYLSTIGLHFVTPRQLNGVLDMAVLTEKPHFTAGEVDWLRNSRAEPANSSSSVLKEVIANSSTGSGQAELENLMLLDHSDRTDVLTDTLLGLLTDALGVEDENLNAESNFASMGIDSLSIMEVQAGINSILQQDLPLSRMFTQDGTVGQLAGRISTYLEENDNSSEDAA